MLLDDNGTELQFKSAQKLVMWVGGEVSAVEKAWAASREDAVRAAAEDTVFDSASQAAVGADSCAAAEQSSITGHQVSQEG